MPSPTLPDDKGDKGLGDWTPGPWRDGNEALHVRLNSAKPWAGTVFRVSEMSDERALVAMVFGASVQECTTTARLIAAAPCLAEALAEALDEILAFDGHVSDPANPAGWSSPDAHSAYMKGAAALAKAQGK